MLVVRRAVGLRPNSRCLVKAASVSAFRPLSVSSVSGHMSSAESSLDADSDEQRAKRSAQQESAERSGIRPLYLDAQATTPMDPRVLDAMLPYLTTYYGNPHSRTHAYGWESEKAMEEARENVAGLIKADPKEIIFTSGATESNNISIKGVAR